MVRKVRYQYREYPGCNEATEKSKDWERTKTSKWSIWICFGFGTLAGANAVGQLITNTYEAEMFWPMMIFFLIFLPLAYSYVFRSKYVYPTCEELFLASQKTVMNSKEIDAKISAINKKKWTDVKRALIKFSVIYFSIFTALTILFCTNT